MSSNIFFQPSNFAMNHFRRISIHHRSPYILNLFCKQVQVGPLRKLSRCQYSTVLHSRCFQNAQHIFRLTSPSLNSISFLSTNGSNENLQVIFTNPAKQTSTTSEFSASASQTSTESEFSVDLTKFNEVSNTNTEFADISAQSTDVSDIAVSLSNAIEVIEPSLSSIGLCNWTPVGLVQMLLEYLHIGLHMPWWQAIVASTIVARFLLLPLLIKTQKNAVNMGNNMPQLQYLQTKFGEARRTGNGLEASRYASEIMIFMKEHKISPIKNALFPMMQAPVFISFFLGLRAMAKAPVESMKDGGIWWVTDLTIPDPYYVLPVVACCTLYVVLKVGAESGVKLENMKMMQYVLKALPFVAFPFCMNFPAAVMYYWCTTNLCTLAVVSVMKIEPVRQYLKMPKQNSIDPKFTLPKKGFVKGMKEAIEDQKILAAVEDRRRMDEIRFQKAGTGPVPRTYSYDPTKPRPANVAATASHKISAKEHKA